MNPKPYADCLEYVEDELCRYLPIRASRLNSEWMLKDLSKPALGDKTVGEKQDVRSKELERRASQYRKQEAEIRSEIDSRLEATRQIQENKSGFSLDLLNGGLDFDARLVLLTLTANALGLGADTIGEIGISYFGSINVGDLMVMLDAHSVADRLRARRLILDLVGMGLVVLDYPSRSVTPEDLNTTSVSIDRKTFAIILDDPSLEHEGVIVSKESH